VWKFDRFARSLKHLLNSLELRALGIAFVSCTEAIDTSLPHGEMLFQIIGAISQWERSVMPSALEQGSIMLARKERDSGGQRYANSLKGRLMRSDQSERQKTRHFGHLPRNTVSRRGQPTGQLRLLVNYTFLTPGLSMQRTNVYAGVKGQILKGFSNMPEILPQRRVSAIVQRPVRTPCPVCFQNR
jgi:hypothetical protein